MKIYNTIALLFCFFASMSLSGQRFHSKLIGGINATQLEGDNLSGFDKIGLQFGAAIQYPLFRKSILLELLYNQKGSSSLLSFGSNSDNQTIKLNYLQIPVLYSIDQWYSEDEDYYKISVEAGPYYSRLFNVDSNIPVFDSESDKFRKNDLGIVLGIRYRFLKSWSIGTRYDRSLLRAYQDPNSGLRGLLSYLISIRIEYHIQ